MSDSDLKERIPPQAVDIEMSVLGAMMLEKDAVFKAMEHLTAEVFYKTAHQRIFQSMSTLHTKSEAIDLITVTEQLKKDKKLEEIGGSYYLTECINQVTSASNVEYHAKIVVEKYMLRSMISISSEITEQSYEGTENAQVLLDKAEQKIFAISEGTDKSGFEKISPILHDAIDVLEKYQKREGQVIGVSTGYNQLDELTAGFQKSDLIIIAGRPSMGKTAFALNVMRHAAITDKDPVGFFSLEMSKFQLATRLLACEGRLDSNQLRRGRLDNSSWNKLSIAAGILAEAPIFIDDTPSLSIFELRSKARRLKVEHGIKMLFVDYLQLMRGPAGKESRQQEISEISRSLKAVAKELDLPVVALSQLSRQPELRGGTRKPMLSDLRESGAIEQDADVVIFIYRPEMYGIEEDDDGNDTTNIAEIIIGKQRNGPTGTVKLTFLKDLGRFENLAKEEEIYM
ncbi:replicative DNA helicase [candidate division KSB1 bacterium]